MDRSFRVGWEAMAVRYSVVRTHIGAVSIKRDTVFMEVIAHLRTICNVGRGSQLSSCSPLDDFRMMPELQCARVGTLPVFTPSFKDGALNTVGWFHCDNVHCLVFTCKRLHCEGRDQCSHTAKYFMTDNFLETTTSSCKSSKCASTYQHLNNDLCLSRLRSWNCLHRSIHHAANHICQLRPRSHRTQRPSDEHRRHKIRRFFV